MWTIRKKYRNLVRFFEFVLLTYSTKCSEGLTAAGGTNWSSDSYCQFCMDIPPGLKTAGLVIAELPSP